VHNHSKETSQDRDLEKTMKTRNISLILSIFALAACDTEGMFAEEGKIINEAISIVADKLSAKEAGTQHVVTRPDVLGEDFIVDGEKLTSTTIDEFGIEIFEVPAGMDREELVKELRSSNQFDFVEDAEDFELGMEDRIFDVVDAGGVEVVAGDSEDFAMQARYDVESGTLIVRHFAQDVASAVLCGADIEDGSKRCMSQSPSDVPGMSLLSLDHVQSGYFTVSLIGFDGHSQYFNELSVEESIVWQDLLHCKSDAEVVGFHVETKESSVEVFYSSEDVIGLTVCSETREGEGIYSCKDKWSEGDSYFKMSDIKGDFRLSLHDTAGCKVDTAAAATAIGDK